MATFVKPEDALKRDEEAERCHKEQAERKAKLDEIGEKQRQRERELEEKEKQWKETILGPSRPVEPPPASNPTVAAAAATPAAAAAAATAPAAAADTAPAAAATPNPFRYVPRFLRERTEGSGAAPPPKPERRKYVPRFLRERTEGSGATPPPKPDRRSSRGRQDDRYSQPSDGWRNDEHRPSSAFGSGGGGSRSTQSSSRPSHDGER
ncbi:eukaryotic translation initiation factor 3 subunit A-like isoform X2 [Eucalyptus grandis]|uniref:eukaryotic translation initiation factor 3 subunit A-like isoform X2 n=1 Tax=Eucalyptus grandis TaxID=71139 RepID=UPI00192EBC9F|nr:eukaryotic translation initiation factor 3 subunit A-like isoform X2 [Eucalyptus grandis]XP_039155160.1 eukaryotic translation initiation factor 3 subunit A-like isoform X2 [Eucalyptus grandis]XP_039155161.1 eukaryotic translation initiation factor 3 subunit A-like isoform X2 [Eucalyptus grandis]XP_039155162.1 eukaryotic translation initiation factor 3 subunit A-like isoform X2 [Eucalyptus grandis]XP_039155163.1 eukaryotic translation initiation factor 3 subunit A-like isoform X2 [Eucalyptus